MYCFVRNIHTNGHRKSKRISSKFDYVESILYLRNLNASPIRSFSSTSCRKGDPLGTTLVAFGSSYASSLLSNPLGGAIVLLMGMATTLFLVLMDFPVFFAQDPPYCRVLQRIDNLLLLCETFIPYEQSLIDILLASMGNFSPEVLNHFYLVLQELVTVRESLFSNLSDLAGTPEIEFLEIPLVDRINENIEDFRLGGNRLMTLLRDIEVRLNIPEAERIPYF